MPSVRHDALSLNSIAIVTTRFDNTIIMTGNKTPVLWSAVGDFYSDVDTGNISGTRRWTMNWLEYPDNIRT